ncbi:MAG TPA: LysM peptidoglycan-binding domain-containing protein [Nevskiaceae bacterium]
MGLLVAAIVPLYAWASAPTAAERTTGLDAAVFPEPAVLYPAVDFWEDIFGEYSTNQSVVISTLAPDAVLEVLDFPPMMPDSGRNASEQGAIARNERALRTIVAAGGDAARMTPYAAQVYRTLRAAGVRDFGRLEGTLHVQRGLRERTRAALERSGRYDARIDGILSYYGLPAALARLPIIESSFRRSAYSFDGAAGIWQFMPSSARLYMTVDAVQDDRRDPWLSTRAAAQLLSANYAALGSWPLAITAWNYGRGGLQQALAATGDSTLAQLIENYRNPRFGFASKNFYAEFLAANAIADHAGEWFPGLHYDAPIRFDTVTTRRTLSWGALDRLADAGDGAFSLLNPEFNPAVVDGRLAVPAGSMIRVPVGEASRFERLYLAMATPPSLSVPTPSYVAASAPRAQYATYRVQPGDDLGRIAQRFGISVAQLMQANGLHDARDLQIDEVLHVPTGTDTGVPHFTSAVYRDVIFRVQPGQTLSGIAAREGSSVAAVQDANHLRGSEIHVGQVLSVPVSGQAPAPTAAASLQQAGTGSTTRYRVQPGQTLDGIATSAGISVAALRAANHLQGSDIRVGELLVLPTGAAPARAEDDAAEQADASVQAATYRVQPGQTLDGIAAHLRVSTAALQAANGLHDSLIHAGQRLVVPRGATARRTASSSRPAVLWEHVRPGQTLSGIAAQHGLSVALLRRANHLRDDSLLRVGMLLRIPAGGVAR